MSLTTMVNTNLIPIPTSVIDIILGLYKSEFVYVSNINALYDKSNFSLFGKLAYHGTYYFNKERNTRIFDNVEATLAANQVHYILGFCFSFFHIDNQSDFRQCVNNYNKLLGKLIIKEEKLIFNKPIKSYNDLYFPFRTKIESCKKTSKGLMMDLDTLMGEENNFHIKTHGFLLNENLHGFI